MSATVYDADAAYRQTQSQIYGLQETLLNANKNMGPSVSDHVQNSRSEPEESSNGIPNTVDCIEVDSKPVLTYVLEKYGCLPEENKSLETLVYHPYKMGLTTSSQAAELPFPYDYVELSMPRPFVPGYGRDKINRLVTIKVSYEDLKNSVDRTNSPRSLNNELWGCQIYTDDSDPILALRHCGISIDENNGLERTPANLNNSDNIQGTIPPEGTPFDLEVDLLLLPTLQSYESVELHGVRSRSWGIDTETPHDGLSYGIYCIRVTTRDTTTQNIDADRHHIRPWSNWKDQ